jgi:predicted nucleotidyltransferase
MFVKSKDDVLTLLRDHSEQLRQLGVRRYALFGSFVRGEQDDASDIDVLVEFAAGEKTFDNFMRLSFFLEELFGRKVDLVTPESLSPYIGPYIMHEAEYATVGA